MVDNLIDYYTNVGLKYTDAPEIFLRAGAYHTVSNLLGRFFEIKGTSTLANRPNEWFVISSIPGQMRRSTVQSKAREVFEIASEKYLRSLDNGMGESDIEDYINQAQVEEGSYEGVIDHIGKSEPDIFAIMPTEFGTSLKKMVKGGSYQAGCAKIYSQLYYGEGSKMHLSQRSGQEGIRSIPSGLYATMFAGMQEPQRYIERDHVTQGLMRRIVLCYQDSEEHDRWQPPINQDRSDLDKKFNNMATKIGEKMVEYNQVKKDYGLIPTMFRPKVEKGISSYWKKVDMSVRKKPDDYNLFRQSYPEHLMKFAVIRAIGKMKIDTNRNTGKPRLEITEQDLFKAKEFLQQITSNHKDVITSLSERREKTPSAEVPLEKVHRIIQNYGQIKRSKLLRESKMKAKDLNDYINTLQEQDKIEARKIETGGRKALAYRIKEEGE